jgi:undecaprenyl-diphosphatase
MSENDIIKYLQSFNNKYLTDIMNIISYPLSLYIFPFVLSYLYYIGKINNNNVYIIILTQIVVSIIKFTFKRTRPFMADNDILLLDDSIIDPFSFPSGHTTIAFLLGQMVNLSIYPYLVGLSRMYLGVHYPTDVLGGIVLSKIMNNNLF